MLVNFIELVDGINSKNGGRETIDLEEFQLLNGFRGVNLIMSPEYFHHSELFICNAHYAYVTFWRKNPFCSIDMNSGVFPANAVPEVNAELKHGKTVCQDILSKFGIDFPLLFCFGGQIKKY